jgi:hypothetical protein
LFLGCYSSGSLYGSATKRATHWIINALYNQRQ